MDYNRLEKFFSIIIVLVLSYLFFWPVKINPVAWTPPLNPGLKGDFLPNSKLKGMELFFIAHEVGPEDVAIDSQGRFYSGLNDGRIIRFQKNGSGPETFVNTGGRPLGLDFDQQDNLLVADCFLGLLRITPDGQIEILSTESDGVPYGMLDDVEVGNDGIIYYSDATSKFSYTDMTLDILEHTANGRLLSYNPINQKSQVLLSGLYFANGVAVSPDQSFVLVNETGRYQIQRYWLKGKKKGTAEIFLQNLPGYPDGISSNDQGIFWLSFYRFRENYIDKYLLPDPKNRELIARLPAIFFPTPKTHGIAIGLDKNANVIYNFQDEEGNFFPITSIQQSGDTLYFGNFHGSVIARKKLDELNKKWD